MQLSGQTMFKGSITALATPFRDGEVDESAFRDFVNWQIDQGTHGLVPCGTTGESPTLTEPEHERVIALCVEAAAGRRPVLAGAGLNDTRRAIELAKHAKRVGADAILVVTPYYNKPNQEGLRAHFLAVADAVEIPLIIYNIPGRSVIDMEVETMTDLAAHPNIIGVKDATGSMVRTTAQRTACGDDFLQLSGDDATTLGFMAHGGHGAISVTSNVAPALCSRFQEACLEGRYPDALALQDRLFDLHQALFMSPSPGPAKYALARLGMMTDELRLPLTPPNETVRARIDAAMEKAGLIPVAAE